MPAQREDLATLEAALGRGIGDASLLHEALTHSSARSQTSNERLEFLGDRVLALVMAEQLIQRYPDESEGQLAPRFNALVRRETCAEIAGEIGLGAHLKMARSEAMAGGRRKAALLGNAMEAILAAIYLDAGLDAARETILKLWSRRLDAQRDAPVDAKTALQEWAQGRGQALPSYSQVGRSGPDHEPEFIVEVALQSGESARAPGRSKRIAEREAAAALLQQLGLRP